jgi:hypothetical protein
MIRTTISGTMAQAIVNSIASAFSTSFEIVINGIKSLLRSLPISIDGLPMHSTHALAPLKAKSNVSQSRNNLLHMRI